MYTIYKYTKYTHIYTVHYTKYTLYFFLSVRRLLVTASVVPSLPNLVTLMIEALSSSDTSVLTRAYVVTSQKTPFFNF
jgi:hypothetical protein